MRIKNSMSRPLIVSFAAVIRVVTHRSSSEQPLVGRSVRDDPNKGCEGDQPTHACVPISHAWYTFWKIYFKNYLIKEIFLFLVVNALSYKYSKYRSLYWLDGSLPNIFGSLRTRSDIIGALRKMLALSGEKCWQVNNITITIALPMWAKLFSQRWAIWDFQNRN